MLLLIDAEARRPATGRALNRRRDAALEKRLRKSWIFPEFLPEMP